ncbi:MAG: hypothetical protein SWK76_09545 [Actinomycetota bacterium]|nr:hypothetical protein [Actinomycetota bacterium]
MTAFTIIIPVWVSERLEEEILEEGQGVCPSCGVPYSLTRVKITRKKMLYSLIPISSKDMGEQEICGRCGRRFLIGPRRGG